MRRFLMVIERADGNYSAYSPDLPGCVSTGQTVEEVKEHMREAIELHLHGLQEDGVSVPLPTSIADYVVVA